MDANTNGRGHRSQDGHVSRRFNDDQENSNNNEDDHHQVEMEESDGEGSYNVPEANKRDDNSWNGRDKDLTNYDNSHRDVDYHDRVTHGNINDRSYNTKSSYHDTHTDSQHRHNRNRPDHNYDDDDDDDDYIESSSIIQVLNVAPPITIEQITNFFSYLGDIIDLKLYQNYDDNDLAKNDYNQLTSNYNNIFKVCYIEFADPSSVKMAQHLTNTVFIDRALTITHYTKSNRIPDQVTALEELKNSDFIYKYNMGFASQVVVGVGGVQLISTIDSKLSALSLPQYPQLPLCTEPNRVEEIRRTVYIGNLDSTMTPDQVLKFFNDIGEVRYLRIAGDETQPSRFAFVEFNHQASVANALQHNGSIFGSRALKINHSNNAIVKPHSLKHSLANTLDPNALIKAKQEAEHIAREGRRAAQRHSSSSRYRNDQDRSDDRSRDRRDRRISPVSRSRSRRSRSREDDSPPRRRRRSRSRDTFSSKRSRSRDRSRDRARRSRSRELSRKRPRRSRSRSDERVKSSSRRHQRRR